MKPNSATAFTFVVRQYGQFLSTRERAKTVLRDLEDQTPTHAATVVIDFTAVTAVTISFADEFVGRYYAALAARDDGPATVTLTGLDEELRETMTVCLERLDLVALEERDGELALLAASDVQNETFKVAQELEAFTAMTVAANLSISAPNANNRLKRLVAARALIRQQRVAERGGKEFTYSFPNLQAKTADTHT